MKHNIAKFRTDLDRLLLTGERLEFAMIRDFQGKAVFEKQIKSAFKSESDEILKNIPDFNVTYQAWYSESLILLKQLLPERVLDFRSLYEKPKSRKSITVDNYVIQDFIVGISVTRGWEKEVVVDRSAAIPVYRQQLAILRAATARFDSSLFEIRQLVQADLFDSELDAARELLKGGFLRAAGAISGVVLEKHLHQVCGDRAILVTKKNPSISDLNELLKSNSVVDVPQWRHITFLADIRNLCDHNKKKEPTIEQVEDLISGTDKVLKTIA